MQLQNLKPPETLKQNSQNPLTSIQTHFSCFLKELSNSFTTKPLPLPSFPESPIPLKTHFDNTIQIIGKHAKEAFQTTFPRFVLPSLPLIFGSKSPEFARAYPFPSTIHGGARVMSAEAIEERLAGIPVYALSNSAEEFVLLSGVRSGKSLGLFCFNREDAEAILEQMRAMDPGMRQGSKVVSLALNKVFQLKIDGFGFRFIPDSQQIMHALKEKEGDKANGFFGVPVFQSQNLILTSENKRYRPVFFKKEDLDKSLLRASQHGKHLNPSFRKGYVQVCAFEDIIKGMQESSSTMWDDVVFIPPGFDVSINTIEELKKP